MDHVVLTPFRLDGLALGAFLAVTARQPGGLERLARALPRVAAVVGGLLAVTFVWTRLVSRQGLELVAPVRAALILILLACLLLWALIAPARSATSRFFCSRSMVFLGTYSYGLYVYHHFISYYLSTNRTELELARWLGSHGAAVALQATLGASASLALAYLSYELFENRFLRLKRLFETAKEPAPGRNPAGRVGLRQAVLVVEQRVKPSVSRSLRFRIGGLSRVSSRRGSKYPPAKLGALIL